ncbi:MAG: hypothetical protein V3V08_25725 [Nannocystaceae bacterium]
MDTLNTPTSHGGLLFPLDVFRPTALAAALAEILVGKTRNVLDARLELIRHAEAPLIMARIHGSVVGDDPAAFWAENPELGVLASQLLPRQCFVYYVNTGKKPRQGFVIAQQGRALAKEDASPDTMPPDASPADWPVARLCEQMRLSVDDLAHDFPGGLRIELSLLEPEGDDQELLRELAGAPPSEEPSGEEPADTRAASSGPPGPPGAPHAPPGQNRGASLLSGNNASAAAAADAKRRATERQEEWQALQDRAAALADGLVHEVDDVGIVVAPQAELSDADLLQPYLQRVLDGAVPAGVPLELQTGLQGRRIDFAVKVDFLSEVFVDNNPLNKPHFKQHAYARDVAGFTAHTLEVLAPRLGTGILVDTQAGRVFVSRPASMPLPEKLIARILRSS